MKGATAEPWASLSRVALAGIAAWTSMVALGALFRLFGGRAGAMELVASLFVCMLAVALAWRRAEPQDAARAEPIAPAEPELSARLERLLLLPLVLVIVLLACARLESFPGLRDDEALFLQYPANWVRHGYFALRLGERFEPALFSAGTGPAILFPVAGLFRAFGESLTLARGFTALCLLAAAAVLWWAARVAFGRGAGLWVLLALAAFPETIETGRMVMGDFAATGLLVAGSVLWLRALEREGRAGLMPLLASGVAFGLMALTKLSFLVAGAGFAGYLLYDRGSTRRARPRHVLVPALAVIALCLPWELWSHLHDRSQLLYASSSGAGSVYATLDLGNTLEKAREAAARPELTLALAGLVLALGRGGGAARHATLWAILALAWLLWFLTFRTVLYRYLIVPSLLALLLSAPVVAGAMAVLRRRADPLLQALALVVATVGVAYPALRAGENLRRVLAHPERETRDARVARRVAASVAPGELLQCSHTPFRILVFADWPFRVLTLEQARELPGGSLYLWSTPSPLPEPGPDLELLWRDDPYALLRRTGAGDTEAVSVR